MRAFLIFLFYVMATIAGLTWAGPEAWAKNLNDDYVWYTDQRYHLYKKGQHYRFETKKNLRKSLSYHLEAAKADYAASQYAVGWIMGFDKDRDPDYEQSLYWMLKVVGAHETPQVPKYNNMKVEAEKALKKLCKRGVVDFPNSHAFSKDPYCWRKRGERLFYGRDKLAEMFGGRKHGVEQDYAKARYYLEKAYEGGQKRAAINLAKIYDKGLGVEADPIKYQKYVSVAAALGDSKTHLALAEKAKSAGRITDYVNHLEVATKTRYISGSRASRELGKIYFEGELAPRDYDKAFMYFFLSGKVRYAQADKLTLPGQYSKMILALRDASTLDNIEVAKRAADDFAKTYKFSKNQKRKIDRSHGLAVNSFHYVQRTGGQWYKDPTWLFYLILISFVICLNGYAFMRKNRFQRDMDRSVGVIVNR